MQQGEWRNISPDNGLTATIVEIEMSTVFFKPWVGADYPNGGVFAKRILVLGEAHYKWKEDARITSTFTQECIVEQIQEKPFRKAFWTNIAAMFLEQLPTLDEKRAFWQSVAYYNFIQQEISGARIRPDEPMWSDAIEPFHATMKDLRPDRIFVLGYRLWERLPIMRGNGPSVEGTKPNSTCWHTITEDHRALVFGMRHPSSGFSSKAWRPLVRRVIDWDEVKK